MSTDTTPVEVFVPVPDDWEDLDDFTMEQMHARVLESFRTSVAKHGGLTLDESSIRLADRNAPMPPALAEYVDHVHCLRWEAQALPAPTTPTQ